MAEVKVTLDPASTPEDPIFNFEIPGGAKGDPGGLTLGTELKVDLNTVFAPGTYYTTNGATTTLANNYPLNGGIGVLVVLSTSTDNTKIYQEWTPITNSAKDGRVFYRRVHYGATGWGTWKAYSSVRVDNTAGRAIYQWDETANREQLIYGDTGWRRLTLLNGWTGIVDVRRVGQTVHYRLNNVNGTVASDNKVVDWPVGFGPDSIGGQFAHFLNSTATGIQGIYMGSDTGLNLNKGSTYAGAAYSPFNFLTQQSWPTSLPGSAIGGIPSA